MTLVGEGNVGLPTVIIIDRSYTMEQNIRMNDEVISTVVAEALAKGNEIVMKSHNDKLFIYELKYCE